MPSAEPPTTTKRETWLDWLPHISDAIPREEFVASINQEYGTGITVEQLQSWEDRGLLPLPIQGIGYPHNAEAVIRTLHRLERERDGIPSDRDVLRNSAKSLDETAALEVRDQLAELQQAAARRETWIDWVPPEGREDALLDAQPLLTRDELVAELRRGGDDINPRNLVHWQSVGVIPYPERRHYKGATRALYPRWAVNTIHRLKSLQDQGYSLREIGPILRGNISHQFMARARTPRQEEEQARRAARQALFPLVEEMDPLIRSLARIHEHLHGGQITHTEVRLIDDQGESHVYPFLTGKMQDDPSQECS